MLTGSGAADSIAGRGRCGPGTGPACLASAALFGLTLVGCVGRPVAIPTAAPRRLPSWTFDQVLEAYEGHCRENETLSASGDLEVRDRRAGRARTLGVRVLADRRGRLYIKGSVAVVTGLEVVSDGQRFWFSVPSKKTVWTGPATGEARGAEADQAPYYALRPKDVTSALLCEPLAPGPGDTVTLEADAETVSLALSPVRAGRGPVRRRVWLDRESLQPVRLRGYDEGGDVQVEVRLGDRRSGQAHTIEIDRPREGYQAVFRLDKVEANTALPDRAFAPRTPEGYQVVEVEG